MQIEVAMLCAVGGFLVSYFAFMRNKDNDTRTQASKNAVIETKLDNIVSGVQDIQVEMRANEKNNEKRFANIEERVTRLEESGKQAHRRIDKLEEKDV